MKTFRNYKAIAVIAWLLLAVDAQASAQARAATSEPQAEASSQTGLDHLEGGRAVRRLIDAINSGSEASITSAVDESFSEAGLSLFMPRDRLIAMLIGIQKHATDLVIREVTPVKEPLTLVVEAQGGRIRMQIRAGSDRHEPDRLAGIGITRLIDLPTSRLASERTPETEAEMVDVIAKAIDRQAETGAFNGAFLLTRNRKVLLSRAYGVANQQAAIGNTIDTPFHIGSVGKMFTSVLVNQFMADGLLSPNTRVGDVIPEFPLPDVRDLVTVEQLLTHQGGLGTFFQSPGYDREKRYGDANSEMAVYSAEPLFFPPGTSFRYSNAGFSLLAAMLERISGKNFETLVRERILDPEGMSNTYLASDHPRMRSAALVYSPIETDPLGFEAPAPLLASDLSAPTDAVQGFGGGYASISDMQRFVDALINGRLLPRQQYDQMIAQRVEQEAGTGRYYGYGVMRSTINGQTMIGHSGAGRFDVRHLVESGYTLTVATNHSPPPVSATSLAVMDFIARFAASRDDMTAN